MVSKLILIAPTWQGPLRVMGLPTVVRNGVKNLNFRLKTVFLRMRSIIII